MGFLYNFAVEELLILAFKTGGALTRSTIKPVALEFSYPAPAHQALYEDQLRREPPFNCRQTRIRFASPGLSIPLKGSDEEFNAICLQHCNSRSVRPAFWPFLQQRRDCGAAWVGLSFRGQQS